MCARNHIPVEGKPPTASGAQVHQRCAGASQGNVGGGRDAQHAHTHTWWDCFCVRGATSLPQPALSAWLSPKCCHPCKHRAKLSPVQTNGFAQPLACSNRPPELSEHEWLLVFDSLCDVWGASCKFWGSKKRNCFQRQAPHGFTIGF